MLSFQSVLIALVITVAAAWIFALKTENDYLRWERTYCLAEKAEFKGNDYDYEFKIADLKRQVSALKRQIDQQPPIGRTENEDLAAYQMKIGDLEGHISRMAHDIANLRLLVDAWISTGVEHYNEHIEHYNEHVEHYKQHIEQYNEHVQHYKQHVARVSAIAEYLRQSFGPTF